MAFYQNRIVPLLINRAMRQRNFAVYRNRIIPAAEGRVLEIGIGSGLNLPFYSRNVAYVIGLEPSPKLLAIARRAQRTAGRLSNIHRAPKVRSHAFVPVARAQGLITRHEWMRRRRLQAGRYSRLNLTRPRFFRRFEHPAIEIRIPAYRLLTVITTGAPRTRSCPIKSLISLVQLGGLEPPTS
jgi:hypothetical protein